MNPGTDVFDFEAELSKKLSELPADEKSVAPPSGSFFILMKQVELKKIKLSPAIIFSYTIEAVDSLADVASQPPAPGKDYSEIAMPRPSETFGSMVKKYTRHLPQNATASEVLRSMVGNRFKITGKRRTWEDKVTGVEREAFDSRDFGFLPI